MAQLTIDDLRRILREAAGDVQDIDLDGDVMDLEFEAIGYDSLALLEAGSRIERAHGITLDDGLISEAATPRDLLTAVNEVLAEADAA
ncbi:Actinorhodin polyketide synthase acyl carrier protein [Actinomadura rubteroloni]|uniref:Actinorhodin polyketide synthase acyl carrier protein n=1 Tax=Actinomadura rubteroloni TaxID=1926885 RepID=A0A2P4UFC0_9ACTN|nr:acyl carrier protein [Actinomadura rubteroloni]POM23764.1 Actinorhodin polyketide synthase acyl carrier protein [Actinomadura rubteroloni]